MDKGKKDLKEVYQKKKTVKKSEKLKTIEEEIDVDLKKAVGDFAKSRTEKYLTESPSVMIPANHFRNIAHKIRYDDVDKFTLKPARTFNWEMSESAVKEFYTGIQTDNTGNDLNVHFCGNEVIITALTLGQALNIEWIKGDVEPPEDFNVNEAWKKLNYNDEVFPTLKTERRVVKEDVKLTFLFIRNNIWFDQSEEDYISEREVWLLSCIWNGIRVNLSQIIINEMKRVADMEACEPSLICGFGHIITTLGVRLRTKYNEHKDLQESCYTLTSPSPQQPDNSNFEIMKMLLGIKDNIREISRS
ncbi:hypothetical protein COLO4_25276 [Corchorus olitorius]|uniref:Putative plant transposon protein domain-containing protein n=1 Tax=Corchorus olitorius TaxID=93759 RepID=A0A1R3I3Q0_9ROSI|nr:hypothetical protein COLO4_25276 [Corchorus olitorius]